MSQMAFLWMANVLVWIGIFGYLAFLGHRRRQLQRRLQQLETRDHGQTGYDP